MTKLRRIRSPKTDRGVCSARNEIFLDFSEDYTEIHKDHDLSIGVWRWDHASGARAPMAWRTIQFPKRVISQIETTTVFGGDIVVDELLVGADMATQSKTVGY